MQSYVFLGECFNLSGTDPDDAMITGKSYSEQQFVESLKSGDDHAFANLYDAYSDMLYGLILQIVKVEEDAENLLQDCFVKIWQRIETYDSSRGRLATWLINIARNIAIDFTRSKYASQKRKSMNLEYVPYLENKFVSTPQIDTIDLPQNLLKLTPKYRETIENMYFGGFSQRELAEFSNIPLGTIKTRTRLALKELRELYF